MGKGGSDRDTGAIWIHPIFSARYYAYYIEGLRQLFPDRTLRISGHPFNGWIGPRDGMAAIVGGADPLRLYFHAGDVMEVYGRELRWADSYGIVNLDSSRLNELNVSGRKILALGPSFPVQIWDPFRSAVGAIRDLPKALREGLPAAWSRRYVGDRRGQALKPRISTMKAGPGDDHYVFHASRWWPDSESTLNEARRQFVDTCRSHPGVQFEGGFSPGQGARVPDGPVAERYSAADYLARTRRSAVVFNAPAVHGCHGWKLGEYLALGKAIISLPLLREMPAPLVHGTHIHFVDTPEAIRAAIDEIIGDPRYRATLERGAREYWDQWLAPAVTAQRMVEHARLMAGQRDPATLTRPPKPAVTAS